MVYSIIMSRQFKDCILSFKQHGGLFNNQEIYNYSGRPHKDSKFSFQDILIKSQVQKSSQQSRQEKY